MFEKEKDLADAGSRICWGKSGGGENRFRRGWHGRALVVAPPVGMRFLGWESSSLAGDISLLMSRRSKSALRQVPRARKSRGRYSNGGLFPSRMSLSFLMRLAERGERGFLCFSARSGMLPCRLRPDHSGFSSFRHSRVALW